MVLFFKRKLFLGIVLFSLSLLTILSFNLKANAIGKGTSLTTSPITLGLNIKPGTSSTQTLKVMNNTNVAFPIVMEIKTFGAYGKTGEAAITNFKTGDPAASYIRITPSSFVAQPKVWESVTATISLPKTASLGYYYAVIFQPLTSVNTNANYIVKGSNAILLLADTSSGNEQKQVEVASFNSTKGLYEYLPATFDVSIHNNGNIYLAPSGEIFISRNSNGTGTIASIPINSGGGNVLPNSYRIFQGSWSNGFPYFSPKLKNGQPVEASNKVVEQLHWNLSKANEFRFGKYYAILALTYNNGTHTILLNSTLSFWVIPWKLMIVGLVILLFLAFGLWFIVRSIIRKSKKIIKKRHS